MIQESFRLKDHEATNQTIQDFIVQGYKPEVYTETTHCSRDFMFFAVQPMLDPLLFKGSVIRYPPTIVDMGSGSNDFGHAIYNRYNLKTINLDVNYAIQKLHPEGTNITASIYKLPFKNESIDIILCKDVLAHVGNEHLDECFEELNRVLKPGGQMLVVFVEQSSASIIAHNPSLKSEEMQLLPHLLASSGIVVYERSSFIYAHSEAEYVKLTQEYYKRGDEISPPFYGLELDKVLDTAESFQFEVKQTTYTQRDDTQDWYTPKRNSSMLQSYQNPVRQILLLTKPA